MKPRSALRIFLFGLIALILVSAASAFAAGLATPAVNVDMQSFSVTANTIKPDACNALSLANIITGAGTITGTSGNDLILGSAGIDLINGMGGDDCILGGASIDTIDGDSDTDVCIGGAGIDIFLNCETTLE